MCHQYVYYIITRAVDNALNSSATNECAVLRIWFLKLLLWRRHLFPVTRHVTAHAACRNSTRRSITHACTRDVLTHRRRRRHRRCRCRRRRGTRRIRRDMGKDVRTFFHLQTCTYPLLLPVMRQHEEERRVHANPVAYRDFRSDNMNGKKGRAPR